MKRDQLYFLKFLFIAICLLFGNHIYSQDQLIKKEVKDNSGITKFVKFQSKEGYKIEEAKTALKSTLNYNDNVEMKLIESKTDKLGMVHQKYQQTYKGLKVENAEYFVHSNNKAGNIKTMNGKYLLVENLNITPTIAESEALKAATEFIGANVYKWELDSEEAFLKKFKGDENATYYPQGELLICKNYLDKNDTTLHLAYKFDIYAQTPTSRNYIYVDAESGDILWKSPIIKHLDENADTRYSGKVYIETTFTDSSYVLNDYTRGNGIFTYNLEKSGNVSPEGDISGIRYGNASEFEDNDNNWSNEEWENAASDNAALDAHWGAMMTFDYFSTTHNRLSFDDNGAAMYLYVHAASDYYNAYWDGEKMTFGDGYSTPLTTLDVTAHELGHAVMEHTANLEYQNESGALNEGFSDIWAACVEYFAAPDKQIWEIGEELEYQIRSMSNPKNYDQPDTYLGENWYEGSEDYGGVHINSGVLNHWFYILSAGKTGENDLGNSYSITGIGIEKAAQIAYRTLSIYLTSTSDYEATALSSIQAAEDLFGEDSDEYIQTINAWYAVGIGGASFISDVTTFCETASITFTDQSFEAVSWNWVFEGGSPTTSTEANPTIEYEEVGTYDVTLIVTNSFGITDTLIQSDYIKSFLTDVTELAFETELEDEDYGASWMSVNANNDTDANGDAFQWNYINISEGNARSGSGYFSYYGSALRSANDWLFTNCLQLEGGKLYDLNFWYKQRDTGSTQNLTFYLMDGTDASQIVSTIKELNDVSNTSYVEDSSKVFIETSGTYYLAWHITSASNQGNFYIDDLSISFAPDIDISIAQIDIPSECELSENTEVTIIASNDGNQILNNVPLNYQVTNSTTSLVLLNENVIIDSLYPGETFEYSFATNLSEIGASYQIDAGLDLDNDANTDNNNSLISLTNYSIVDTISITQSENTLMAPDGFVAYQWYRDSTRIFLNGTSQTYSNDITGDYYVIVRNEYGCSKTSDTYSYQYYVTTSLDDEIEGSNILLYPNPLTSDDFTIEISGSEVGTVNISIVNLQGQILEVYNYEKNSFDFAQKIIASNLPSGMFLALITLNDKTIKEKVLKI